MISSVAYLSMHTSPLLQPGRGSAGGMNIYLHELARTMAARDIEVVVFTRRTDPSQPDVVEPRSGYRVVHVDAGPVADVPTAELPRYVGEFVAGVLGWTDESGTSFDVLHSHYWLSGWAGVLCKERLGIPLANSFHTLGRVKDANRRIDEPASSALRTFTEEEVIALSDCVIASTPFEFDDLLDHYGADPGRLCTSPPGIDHDVFRPGDADDARRWLGLGTAPIVLFVGRIQPLKGLDIAVEAVAGLPGEFGVGSGLPHLVVVGGPSGSEGEHELTRAFDLALRLGLEDRFHVVPPQPHTNLAGFYRAANLLVMPSRSETFGLVAAEAQACGLPVVASAVGGLPHVVCDGTSGFLVDGLDPADYTTAMLRILGDPAVATKLSDGAIEHAEQFSWSTTADRLLELYTGITGK